MVHVEKFHSDNYKINDDDWLHGMKYCLLCMRMPSADFALMCSNFFTETHFYSIANTGFGFMLENILCSYENCLSIVNSSVLTNHGARKRDSLKKNK